MGGREAIRGFAIQTLVCLLDAVATDDKWLAVTIEPDSSNDKVDILWRYADRKRFVQVKSSKNTIGKPDVERWADDLKKSGAADDYEIRLAGPVAAAVSKKNIVNGVRVPTPSSISLFDLIEQAITKLDKYLSNKNIETVPVAIREELVDICSSRLLNGSSVGREITREAFDGWLLHWITTSYPQALATRLASNCEILWGSFDLLSPSSGSRAFGLSLPLMAFNAGRGAAVIEWLLVQVSSDSRRMLYAPDHLTVRGDERPFSKFVIGPSQSLDFVVKLRARSKDGFSTDTWPLGSCELEVFAKFSAADSPRSIGKTSIDITGDHMKLLNGAGPMTFPVSTLQSYIDSL
jgi:hypothetical protein